jgi:hypothetical protein
VIAVALARPLAMQRRQRRGRVDRDRRTRLDSLIWSVKTGRMLRIGSRP